MRFIELPPGKSRHRAFLSALALLVGLFLHGLRVAAAEEPPAANAPAATLAAPAIPVIGQAGGAGGTVVVVPIKGTIDLGLAPFVKRVLEENPGALALVLEVDTFGGRVDGAVQIRDALLEAPMPVVAFVHHRAISAGALITYAADTIVFAPGASMGAATPVTAGGGEDEAVDEKMVSYMRAEMRATAEARGRRGDIAEAMVDKSLVVEGISDADKLLTVTTDEAIRLGIAAGTSASVGELLASLGLERAERLDSASSWSEDLARMLTDPTVSGLLMSLGTLGLLIELYTPGLSLAGALGVTFLALFFGGHLLAGLAGWEEVLVLVGGLALVGVEIFALPGFGVVGIAGILLVGVALAMSLVGIPLGESWEAGLLGDAVQRVLVSLAATAVGVVALATLLPARAMPRWLVLSTRLGSGVKQDADSTARANPDQSGLVGQEGTAMTDLRPSGKARIGTAVVDVVSQLAYIDAGTPVVVVEVEGVRVVVVALPA
ncbi:MAG: nodulation protein NfeD [Deltaproteobacteria bacterium]|nr:nodulation protein NfeD [Deltaproteobacteria bacterium]